MFKLKKKIKKNILPNFLKIWTLTLKIFIHVYINLYYTIVIIKRGHFFWNIYTETTRISSFTSRSSDFWLSLEKYLQM